LGMGWMRDGVRATRHGGQAKMGGDKSKPTLSQTNAKGMGHPNCQDHLAFSAPPAFAFVGSMELIENKGRLEVSVILVC